MNHSGHSMSGMDHSGHNMSGMMDHSGHNMSGMMNHTGHNMSGMDHSGHDMSGMDHSGHDMSGMDHSGHDMSGMTGMMMYFHTGFTEFILLEDCKTESKGAMVGACFFIFFVAILYEGLKFLREVLLQRSLRNESPMKYADSKGHQNSSQEAMVVQSNIPVINRILSGSHCLQTVLHVVQVFVSYCLMLVFMTYNVWLCVAVVLGTGVGYFVFGWKRAVVVDANEHCH